MKKRYNPPLMDKKIFSKGDVIVMSDTEVDVSKNGWGDFDEGGVS